MSYKFNDEEILAYPHKVKLLYWLAFLDHKDYLVKSNLPNYFHLNSISSSWFLFGIERNTNRPFVGVQEIISSWFMNLEWKHVAISVKTGYIYFVLGVDEKEDIVLGIKTKRKMLKLIWETNIEREKKEMDFRITHIDNANNVEIGETTIKTVKLTFLEKIKRRGNGNR